MRSFRDLFSLIFAGGVLQLGGGVLAVLLPLALDASGARPAAIGLVQAAFAAGFIAGALAASMLIRRMGPIRTYSAAAAASAALTLALFWQIDPLLWAVLRAVQGFAFVVMLAAAESWLAASAPQEARGSVLGVYHVVTKLAQLAGPFLIIGLAPLGPGPFMIAAGVLAISLIPICATRHVEPAPPPLESYPLPALWRAAPAAVLAAFVAGISNSGVVALLPVYATRLAGDAVVAAAALNAAAMIGGVLLQWPAGRLSDRRDRRMVIGLLAGVSALGAMGLMLLGASAPLWLALVLTAVWGAGALSIYGVAVAHAAAAAPPGQTQRAITLMLLIWSVGAVAGPAMSGVLMQGFGPRGLFVGAALAALGLGAAMLARRPLRATPEPEDKTPYEPAGTTSPAAAAIDPRP